MDKLRKMVKALVRQGLPIPMLLHPLIRLGYGMGVAAVESSTFLWKLVFVEPILRSVCECVGTGLRAERLPYIRGKGRVRMGDGVNLSGRSCFYFLHGMPKLPLLSIGCRTFIGNACTFSAGRSIAIGDDCLISACVRIHDNDGHPLDPDRRRRKDRIRIDETAPVVIGNNVWIGAGAVILKGVTIGENSVVGASAVVTHDVPCNTVVGGNPARVIDDLNAMASRQTREG